MFCELLIYLSRLNRASKFYSDKYCILHIWVTTCKYLVSMHLFYAHRQWTVFKPPLGFTLSVQVLLYQLPIILRTYFGFPSLQYQPNSQNFPLLISHVLHCLPILQYMSIGLLKKSPHVQTLRPYPKPCRPASVNYGCKSFMKKSVPVNYAQIGHHVFLKRFE